MSKQQLIGIALGVIAGVLNDLASFAAAKKADPAAEWNWLEFWRHVVAALSVGLGVGTVATPQL